MKAFLQKVEKFILGVCQLLIYMDVLEDNFIDLSLRKHMTIKGIQCCESPRFWLPSNTKQPRYSKQYYLF